VTAVHRSPHGPSRAPESTGGSDWREEALCRDTHPAVWFPYSSDTAAQDYAVAICRRCPVMDTCRDYALSWLAWDGVWGGMSEAELRSTVRRIRKYGSPEPRYRPLPACGTEPAYRRHRRRGEACESCRRAASQVRALRQERQESA
jgi:WhiB family redox-sensing transcriptional regulator